MKIGKPVEAWKLEIITQRETILRDLPREAAIESLEPIPCPSWNAIFRARSSTHQYCLKIMNEESVATRWRMQELDYIGNVVNSLYHSGLRYLTPPVVLETGRCAFLCAGYKAVLFPWSDDPAGVADRECFARVAAPVLFRLHSAGRTVVQSANEPGTSISRKLGPKAWACHAAALWDESARDLAANGTPSDVITALVRLSSQVSAVTAQFPEFFAPSCDERTILHGDFRPENVSINGDRVSRVFDFDFMRLGLPEEDLAYSALSYSCAGWFSGSCDWQACAAFINCYRRTARAHGFEVRASLLEAALYWVILKELSLSFRPHEVPSRCKLFHDLREHMGYLLNARETSPGRRLILTGAAPAGS
ncbi:MAG: phosphotransferase enzyme family protein [Bryobacteraceae bacterium]